MTSLALTHASANPPFDATYYATIATIIPVLFLAIAVQGRLYPHLLKTLTSGDLAKTLRPGLPVAIATWFFWIAAWLVPVAGFAGEAGSVIPLYLQYADGFTRLIDMLATLFLLLSVLAPAMAGFMRAVEERFPPGERHAGQEPSLPDPQRGNSLVPEPGKTDTEG
jgi:hypothetical protein